MLFQGTAVLRFSLKKELHDQVGFGGTTSISDTPFLSLTKHISMLKALTSPAVRNSRRHAHAFLTMGPLLGSMPISVYQQPLGDVALTT